MQPRELYGLPLERFTEERNALAKRLRRDGRRTEAAEVSKLRKPSVAAWAVNQLARTQSRDLKALFKSGDALQRTQAELLAGRSDPAALRAAVEDERAAVGRLVDHARGLLSSEGHELSPAGLDQVTETLHAAALDQDARALVSDGCLTRELRQIGLGGLTADPSPPRRRATPTPKPSPKAPDGKREAAERRARMSAARRAQADARRRLERAARQLTAAEERQRRAESELQSAEEALAQARAAHEEANLEHERARTALEGLT